MSKEPQTNIVTSDSDSIRLLNLDQIQAGPCCLVRIQIGYAIFHLRWKDVTALSDRLAKPSRETIVAKCHFVLSKEGRKRLRTLVEQALSARTTYEQRKQKEQKKHDPTQQQKVEAEWLRCMRGQ